MLKRSNPQSKSTYIIRQLQNFVQFHEVWRQNVDQVKKFIWPIVESQVKQQQMRQISPIYFEATQKFSPKVTHRTNEYVEAVRGMFKSKASEDF